MGRLIDADALIELLRNNTSNDIQDQIITENNINLIMSIPTAYDVEKVVAELEEEYDHWADVYNCNKDQYSDGTSDGLNFAIKIVMNGGKE